MHRLALLIGICTLSSLTLSGAEPSQSAQVDFELEIRPIFNEHCVACHGGVKQAADISFIHRDLALSVIEPGDPDNSELVARIKSDDEFEVMPPPEHGAPLSETQIDTLSQWIKQGAKWNLPWAYEKPVAPELPTVSNLDWCRQPLDQFVMARLDREHLKPARDASPSQWLRRVTLDLTGIPPTPEQHNAFVAAVKAIGDTAYEQEVDRLLEQHGYGERWASIWLDQVRYADSAGLGLDGRREIWKYRDWVIDSLNSDMPFDIFTIKQIAGDLLPEPTTNDLVATAANRLTQTNQEGGTDDEEFRINAVLDRVSTVWQTWQGITFGCVQCHSHPYDPINHDEFYKFAAFFNNTADSDLDEELPVLQVPLDPNDELRASRLDREIKSLEESIWAREFDLLKFENAKWRSLDDLTATSDKDTRVGVEVREGNTEFHTLDTLSEGTTITLTAKLPSELKTLTAIRLTILPRNPKTAKADSEWGFVLSELDATLQTPEGDEQPIEFVRVIGDDPHPFKDPNESLNPMSNDGFAAYSRIYLPREAAFVLKAPIDVVAGSKLTLKLKNRVQLLGAFPLVTRRGHVAVSDQPSFGERLAEHELVAQHEKLTSLRDERNKIPSSRTPILSERPEHLKRPTHVFIRGLFLTKAEEVQPDVPASMAPLPQDVPRDRLTLARWLVSDDNPLTARVTVNRVWANLFGIGLVLTEEDFGSSGERPSHPELLDFLGTQFQGEQQWSFKRLIRSIVLSSTYRQEAAIRQELAHSDPQNRLLARGPRFRMPAEMVRDYALAASGLLSTKMHGPPVFPPIPDGIWKPFAGEKWDTAELSDPNRYRRSLYTYTKRSIPYPMFAAFDAPSREFCTPRRLRSNTPLQALMTLNDITFVECAESLASRMSEVEGELSDKIHYGFVAVATREPKSGEIAALVKLYQELRSDSADEMHSLVAVASVLLNLDEIMSK